MAAGISVRNVTTKSVETIATALEGDNASKTFKIVNTTIELAGLLGAAISPAVKECTSCIKDYINVHELKGVWKNMKQQLKGEKKRFTEVGAAVTLLCMQVMKNIQACAKWGLINLGIVGKYAIGNLPVFSLVTDGFALVSSGFSGYDNVVDFAKARSKVANKADKMEKRKDWSTEDWKKYYQEKLQGLQAKIALEPQNKKMLDAKILKTVNKIFAAGELIDATKSPEEQESQYAKLVKNRKIESLNAARKGRTKEILSLLSTAFKIAGIAASIIIGVVCLQAVFILAASMTLRILSNGLSLAKSYV